MRLKSFTAVPAYDRQEVLILLPPEENQVERFELVQGIVTQCNSFPGSFRFISRCERIEFSFNPKQREIFYVGTREVLKKLAIQKTYTGNLFKVINLVRKQFRIKPLTYTPDASRS